MVSFKRSSALSACDASQYKYFYLFFESNWLFFLSFIEFEKVSNKMACARHASADIVDCGEMY